jgi:hypothetical protein
VVFLSTPSENSLLVGEEGDRGKYVYCEMNSAGWERFAGFAGAREEVGERTTGL